MPESLAYLNGQFLSASQLVLPVHDRGLVQGAAVSEQMRTFRGRLFRLNQHLARLERSLEIVGVAPGLTSDELGEIATELAERNHQQLERGDDLGLSLFITPGPYPAFAADAPVRPTVCMHTYALPFRLWVERFEQGQPLVVTDIQQVPTSCWPAELKCRSRMHYYLADRQAVDRQPGSRALLLDADGYVVEASTANLVIYRRDEGLVSPPREKILPGVSVAVLEELAKQRRIPFGHRELTVQDVADAEEALLSSTSPCVLSVVSLDGRPIGSGRPGPVYRQLLGDWSELVGVDIAGQARRFSDRESP